MLIKQFANYVMKSRWHYTLVAFFLSIIPGFGWLGIVVMGLVTLQLGAVEGFLVLLWCALPSIAMAINTHTYWILIDNIVLSSFFVWILALGLRRTHNWAAIVEFSTLMALSSIVLVHFFFPGIEQFWVTQLSKYYQELASQFNFNLDQAAVDKMIQMMAPYLTGAMASFIMVSVLFQLIMSRSIQLIAFTVRPIEKEWRSIRFNVLFALIAVIFSVLAVLNIGYFRDLFLVVLVPFLVSGFSLIHAFFIAKKVSSSKMILFYMIVAIIAVLFWPLLGIFICFGLVDSFINFRSRFRF